MSTFPATLALSSLNGINGFTLKGGEANDSAGFSVSAAGDFNGDGIADLMIGAYAASTLKGKTYIVLGQANQPSAIDLNAPGSSPVVTIQGANIADISGFSVSHAGDVNGDGKDDIIIGARRADGGAEFGRSYVVYGTNNPPVAISLASLGATEGFTLNGIDTGDLSGTAVSAAGDFNGDGFDDVLVSAELGDPNNNAQAGETYLVYGSASPTTSLDLSSLNGTNGFVLNGIAADDRSGSSVSTAGDFNGDGKSDIIIGAPQADPNGQTLAGEAYVVFGNNTNTASSFDLSTLNGINGFTIPGLRTGDFTGISVSYAGDINGDGKDDIIIGAHTADLGTATNTNEGKAYVIFGTNAPLGANFDLASLNGTNGFALNGPGGALFGNNNAGRAVSAAGDLNSDGIDDLIVGEPNGDSFAGKSYVVFGSTSGFAPSRDLSALNGTNGFVIEGISGDTRSGRAVSSAGDVNGDGINDIVIGAYRGDTSNGTNSGESYVIYGRNNTPSAGNNSLFGTSGNDTISAQDGNDTISGGEGSDILLGDNGDDLLLGEGGDDGFYGGEGADTLSGGDGNDFLIGQNGTDELNGGTGSDVLVGGAGNDALNGNEDGDTLYGNEDNDTLDGGAGIDTLYGGAGNDSVRGGDDNDFVQGGSGLDTIYGDAGNDRLDGEGDSDTIYGGLGNDALYAGDGFDSAFGGADDDYLFGGAGNDTLEGNEGSDVLYGGTGNDWLKGGAANDVLFGDAQNDSLEGEAGADNLYGGIGQDILRGGADDDGLQGGDDDDALYGDGGNDRLYGEGGADTLWGGEGNDGLNGGSENDILNGEAGNDGLNGGEGNDTLNGGEGDDYMMGNAGDDEMIGGIGSDFIFGGIGSDRLVGSEVGNNTAAQIDILVGGEGSDTFVVRDMYKTFGENDFAIIQDFNIEEDTIETGGATYSLVDVGGNLPGGVGLYDGGELLAVIQRYSATQLDVNASYFVQG